MGLLAPYRVLDLTDAFLRGVRELWSSGSAVEEVPAPSKEGRDLLLQTESGEEVRLLDYFATQATPDLTTTDGATLRGATVEKLAGPLFAGQYAQVGGVDLASAIGQVETLEGKNCGVSALTTKPWALPATMGEAGLSEMPTIFTPCSRATFTASTISER